MDHDHLEQDTEKKLAAFQTAFEEYQKELNELTQTFTIHGEKAS